MLLRSRRPTHRNTQLRGHFAKAFERPAFGRVTGEGVYHGKVLDSRRRDSDRRHAFRRRRKRGEKSEGKMADGVAEIGAIRSVPGIDGIEGFEFRDAGVFDHAQQIEAGIGDRTCAIGEADQGKHRAGGPDFRIRRAGGFKRGERQDDIADRSGANQQAARAND